MITRTGIIKKATSEFFNITEKELGGKSQKHKIVYPRQIAMYLIRKQLRTSYPNIGYVFGGKDHTTVISACEKIDNLLKNNENTYKEVNSIKKKINIAMKDNPEYYRKELEY